MHVFIVFAHPSEESFTRHVKDSFIRGLEAAGHSYTVSDLYRMGFQTDMTEAEYLREGHYRLDLPLSPDVLAEQEKVNRSDAIVFIYPIFWTEAPAKLVGWFDRVWTYGFAYGEGLDGEGVSGARGMKTLEKGLVLCIAGNDREILQRYGHLEAMKTVMLTDRLADRVQRKDFVMLDRTTRENPEIREENWQPHLDTAYRLGLEM